MVFSVVSKKSKKTYYLHSKVVKLRSGREHVIYYFASSDKGGISALPAGYEVTESVRTGLPMLKKKS